MTISRERTIELLVVGLAAAILYSALLRDVFAGTLLAVLLWERLFSAEESRDRVADVTVAMFVAITLATALLSRWPEEALLDLRFYPYGILLFFGARRVAEAGRTEAIALAVLVLVAILALDVVAQVATGASLLTGRTPVWNRYTGSFPFPADIALLPILLPLTADARVAWWMRPLAFALVTAAVAASGTRAALLALAFVAAAETLTRHRRAAMTTFAILFFGFAFAAVIAPGPAERLFGLGGGAEHRLVQWKSSLEAASEAPLLGHGPHSFRRLALERIASGDPAFAAIDLRYAPYPHSVYLETLVGSGIAGLTALLAVLALPFRRALGDATPVVAARIAVAAFAWVALFDMSLKKDWVELAFWLPLGVAVGGVERQRFRVTDVGAEPGAR